MTSVASVNPVPAKTPTYAVQTNDCLAFLQSLPAKSVDLIVTDPAYSGMNKHLNFGQARIVGDYSNAGEAGAKWFTQFADNPRLYLRFLRECHRVLRDDRHIYIMFDSYSLLRLGRLVDIVFSIKNLLVWDKVHIGMGNNFRRRHEHIVFATKGKRKLNSRALPDVIQVQRIHRAAYPTQKPVALFDILIAASTDPGFVVCDPFVGSGAVAVSALKAGCDFVGADVSATAVALAANRCRQYLTSGLDPLEVNRVSRRRHLGGTSPVRPRLRRRLHTLMSHFGLAAKTS